MNSKQRYATTKRPTLNSTSSIQFVLYFTLLLTTSFTQRLCNTIFPCFYSTHSTSSSNSATNIQLHYSPSLLPFLFVKASSSTTSTSSISQNERNERSKLAIQTKARRRYLFHSAIERHYHSSTQSLNSNKNGNNNNDDDDENGKNENEEHFYDKRNQFHDCIYYNNAKKMVENANNNTNTNTATITNANTKTNNATNGTANVQMAYWTIEYCPLHSIRMLHLIPLSSNNTTTTNSTTTNTTINSSSLSKNHKIENNIDHEQSNNHDNNNNNDDSNSLSPSKSSIIIIDSQEYIIQQSFNLGTYLLKPSMEQHYYHNQEENNEEMEKYNDQIYKIYGPILQQIQQRQQQLNTKTTTNNNNNNNNNHLNELSFYIHGDKCPSTSYSSRSTTSNIHKMYIQRATKVHEIEWDVCCHVHTNNYFNDRYVKNDIDNNDDDGDGGGENSQEQQISQNGFKIIKVMEVSQCRYSIMVCQCHDLQHDDGHYNSTNTTNDELHDKNETKIDQDDDDNDEEKVQSIQEYYTHLSDEETQNLQETTTTPSSTTTTTKSYYEILQQSSPNQFPPIPPSKIQQNKNLLSKMFYHAYDSYMYHAYPASEIKPLSCTPGTFHLVRLPALTLIDTLDTLLILGNYTEFARSVERLRMLDLQMKQNPIWEKTSGGSSGGEMGGLFAVNQNVSVFETNIRVLGGLLSAHQMAEAWMDGKVLKEDVFFMSDDNDDDNNDEIGGVLIGQILPKKKKNHEGDPNTATEGDKIEDTSNVLKECIEEESSLSINNDIPKDHTCSSTTTTTTTAAAATNNQHAPSKAKNTTATNEQYWKYDGILLQLAYDIGKRLLPAFQSKTGIPYGTVNLLYGIPPEETQVASLAGAGSLSIEMELLSRLSGDESFGRAAKLACRALWLRRSEDKMLLGKHINVETGQWRETLSGVGSNSDSFYEYLLKHYLLFPEDNDFYDMFQNMYEGIFDNARQGDWYPNVDMSDGFSLRSNIFESLAAFYPGMQVLLGELTPAARSESGFINVREYLGFLPERFDFSTWSVLNDHAHHPLRPEIHESSYFLHMAMKDIKVNNVWQNQTSVGSSWLWSADFAIHELEKITKAKCGYAVVKSVSPQSATESLEQGTLSSNVLQDEMPSFFLSETLKYFYLAFDADNIINKDKERNWIFTTEAHPIHHVPIKKPTRSKEKSGDVSDPHDTIKRNVMNMLKMRIVAKSEDDGTMVSDGIPLESISKVRLEKELWSKLSTRNEYNRNMRQLSSKAKKRQVLDSSVNIQVFGRILTGNETSDINFATIEHAKSGRGSHLTKSCPNFHHPNALWLHALTGHQLSYTDLFESRFSDDDIQIDLKVTSALISSALLGLTYEEQRGDVCSLRERNNHPKESVHSQSTNSAPLGSQRVDMGQDLGSFDISVYNGEGFFIKHVKSGESVEATIIQDDQAPFIAVESYVPAKVSKRKEKGLLLKSLGSSFSKLKSVFIRKKDIMMYPYKIEEKFDRKVLVSDMQKKVYSCSVDVFQASGPMREKSNDSSGESSNIVYKNKKVLGTFPCLPATYGPTELSTLNQNEGHAYEAILNAPDETDPFACEKLKTNEVPNTKQTSIDLVERGVCNFRSKAINLGARNNAEAVIIINTEGGKLFVMAGPEEDGVDYSNEPASVLITKEDGDEITRILNEKKLKNGKKSQILARVNLHPQSQTIDPTNPDWPHVITETDSVQVLASQGWGITAKKDNGQWGIYILQHDGGKK